MSRGGGQIFRPPYFLLRFQPLWSKNFIFQAFLRSMGGQIWLCPNEGLTDPPPTFGSKFSFCWFWILEVLKRVLNFIRGLYDDFEILGQVRLRLWDLENFQKIGNFFFWSYIILDPLKRVQNLSGGRSEPWFSSYSNFKISLCKESLDLCVFLLALS